ncbi:MAG: divergent polysaccharide deacetylase family protein [Woeseiaceae bacterium]|nr:divergent polysaccharide deacetylase family protein [Woeseiaceae bacterium]
MSLRFIRPAAMLAALLPVLAAADPTARLETMQPDATEPVARIAIIIDDLGYALGNGQRAVDLPGPVACAILPGTPAATRLAGAAADRGKEVLLHLPMQATQADGKDEPDSITLDMSRRAFAETFDAALESVPHAIGVNNHRGSLLTRHPGHMQWLMEELSARDELFFVDSYTTHLSVALQIAAETGVPAIKRDVFLDPDRSAQTVEREFARLKRLAHERGVAVAIGHPYDATLDLLERELPRLAAEGIELVPISELTGR